MHSYGGVVVSNSLDGFLWPQRQTQRLPGGVVGLVYMPSFVIPAGTCLNTPFGGDNAPFLDFDAENDLITMQNPRQAFYAHIESDDEAQKWLDLTVLGPAQVNTDVLEFEPDAYIGKGVDATYLICIRDKELNTQVQEGMATLLGEHRRMEYSDAGHCAMIGYGDVIAGVVERAWWYTKDRLSEE